MVDMPSCFGTVKSPQERAENDCVTCRYVRQCDTVETEIRSLREQAAQERAGIVAWLRADKSPDPVWPRHIAFCIERREDKELRA
jgi:hypothetical protein